LSTRAKSEKESEVEEEKESRFLFLLVNNVSDSLILKQTDTICFSSVVA